MLLAKVCSLILVASLFDLATTIRSKTKVHRQVRWCPKVDNSTKPPITVCLPDTKKVKKCQNGNLVQCRDSYCSPKTCHRSVIDNDWRDTSKKMCKKTARPVGDKDDCEVFYDCGRYGNINRNRCHPQLVWQDSNCEYREKVDCKTRKLTNPLG